MSNDNQTGLDFEDIDALLDASMDDLDDLPPQGVPPTGHYNLTMSFELKDVGEGKDKKTVPACVYIVDAINELKDEDERGDVAVGQEFTEFFFLLKKDGEKNKFGIGNLKLRLKPFQERFGTDKIGELIKEVKQVAVSASIKRKVNPKNEDQYNMQVKDVVLM